MTSNAASFLSLSFVSLALAMARLLEMPNKINLSREDYLTVRQISCGSALLGFVVVGAMFSTLILTIMPRRQPKTFVIALITLLCIVGTQVVFQAYTCPANRAKNNWTFMPEKWMALQT